MNEDNQKLDRALEQVNERGFDGLIIYSNGTSYVLRPSYLHYFSGLRPLGRNNAVIISKSGDVALLIEPPWDLLRASKQSWIEDTRSSSDFVKDLIDIMGQFGIKGSVGIVGSKEMTEDTYASIGKQASIELADDIIEEIAREKTKEELDIIRKTARIADIGFNEFLEYTRVGIREYELTAEMEYAMRSAGADDNFTLMSSDKHNYAMRAPRDRRLSQGDIVLAEITPVCEGQFIQLCRTVVLGKPDAVLTEKYSLLMRAFEASLNSIKAGAPASSISKAMNKVIGDAGYAEYCYPPHMRARGHGLGVGSIAPGGEIDDNTQIILEKDQVLIVHPNQYFPETGYLACGETVLVTDSGVERLSKTETKLYVKED
ncbi:M24 family metallopeptidase [Chloroflexota bacterium]